LLRSRGRSIDDTEDLIQEAFLRLQVYCRDKDVAQTEAFLVRTALNLSIDQHRRATTAALVPGALDRMQLIDPQSSARCGVCGAGASTTHALRPRQFKPAATRGVSPEPR
jgi:DNA-directed RNA polymerase specialized sigma24 family protein